MSCSDVRSYSTYQNYLATKNQTGCCCYLVGPTGPTGPGSGSSASSSLMSGGGATGPAGERGEQGEKGDQGDRGDAGPTGPALSVGGSAGDIPFVNSLGTLSVAESPHAFKWSASNNLDVSANNVTMTSTNNIEILSRALCIGTSDNRYTGELQLMEQYPGTDYISLKASTDISGNTTYSLPSSYPLLDGQVLTSTKAGVMNWGETTTAMGDANTPPSGYFAPVIELSNFYSGDTPIVLSGHSLGANMHCLRFLPPRKGMYSKISVALAPKSAPPAGNIQACIYVSNTLNSDPSYTCIAQSSSTAIPSSTNFSGDQVNFLSIGFQNSFRLNDTSGHLVAVKWKPTGSDDLELVGSSHHKTNCGGAWFFRDTGSAPSATLDVTSILDVSGAAWFRIS